MWSGRAGLHGGAVRVSVCTGRGGSWRGLGGRKQSRDPRRDRRLKGLGGGGQLLQELARGDGRGGVCAAVRGPRLGLEGRGSRLRSVTVPCESHKEPSRTGRGGGG